MPARRVRIAAIVAVLLIAAVVFLPRTPLLREWALQRVQTALADQGYALGWDRSSGNLWSEVRLTGADIEGPGVDLTVERLRVGYFLPSLLASELPISLEIVGIEGSVDLGELPTTGTGGGAVGIRPVFEQVAVREVSVDVDDIPFTIPDVTLTELDLEQTDGRFAFATVVRTAEGSLRAEGDIGLAPFVLDARVEQADLAIARHWWSGITGGIARGTVRVDEAGIRADVEVSDGSLAWLGLDVAEVAGPVRYRHPVVEGELRGMGLGGPARANARVDIGARRWQGDVDGSAPLPEVARWITRNMAFDTQALDLTGDAVYELSAAGWTTVTLEGDAQGAGSLLGRPLRDLSTDIRFTSGSGIRVDAVTGYADGAVRATVTTGPDGLRIEGAASGLDLGAASVPDAGIDLRFTSDGPVGDGTASIRSRLAGRDVVAEVDLTADPEGWQFFADGSVGDGTLTAATVFDDGMWEGGARLVGLDVPALAGSPRLTASWQGPWDALAVAVELDADEAVSLQTGGVSVDADLRGSLQGALANGTTYDVSGAFGPVDLSAAGDLRSGALDVAVAPVELAGRVATTASVRSGTLRYGPEGLDVEATLEHEALALPGVQLRPATWDARGTIAPATRIQAATEDGTATVLWTPPTLTADLAGLEAVVGGRETSLDGTIALAPSEGLRSLTADVRALVDEGEIALAAEPGPALSARLPAGFRAGPVQLEAPLAAEGVIDAETGTLQITGTVGDVALDVDVALDPVPRAVATVSSGGETATIRLGGDVGIEAVGRLQLGPVGRVLGFDLAGLVEADLRHDDGVYDGTALVQVEQPVGLSATFTGRGATVAVDVNGAVAGQEVDLEGTVVPGIELRGRIGPLDDVALAGDALGGSGQLPALALGPLRVPAMAWQLQGSVPEQRLTLVVGDSRGTLTWQQGWRVEADLAVPGQIGALDATLRGQAAFSSADPSGTIRGEVLAEGPATDGPVPIATLSGDLGGLGFEVEAPADLLLDAFSTVDVVQGTVSMSGRVDLAPLAVRANGAWRAGDAVADLALTAGPDAPFRAELDTDEISATFDGGVLTLGGVGGDLAPFLSPTLLARLPTDDVTLRGQLQRTPTAWEGTLEVGSGALEEPLVLEGSGEALRVSFDGPAAGSEIELRGTLLPTLELHLSATAGPARLAASLTGPWTETDVSGTLTVEPLSAGPLAMEALALNLTGGLTPLRLSLPGDGIDLSVGADGWSGSGRWTGRVAGVDQRVSFDVGGPLAGPVAEIGLEGPVQGSLTAGTNGASGVVDVLPSAFTAAVPVDAPVRVTVTARPDLTWEADVRTSAPLAGARLALSAGIVGERLAYRGSGRVATDEGTLATLELTGAGADAELRIVADALEGAALAELVPAAHEARASGSIVVRSEPVEVSGSLSFDAVVGEAPLSLQVALPPAGGLELDATLADTVIRLTSDDLTRATFTLASSGPVAASMTGATTLDRSAGLVVDVEAQGTVSGERLAVEANYRAGGTAASEGGPTLEVALASTLGDARLALEGSGDDATDAWDVRIDLERLAGAGAGRATLDGTLDWTGPRGAALDLSGAVALLQPDVSFDVSLAASPNDAVVAVTRGGLVARATLGLRDAAGVQRPFFVEVTGADTVDIGPLAIALHARDRFTWTAADGFGGRLSATIDAAPLRRRDVGPVSVELWGERVLRAVLDTPEGVLAGEIVLDEQPWRDRDLQGVLTVNVPARTPAAWGFSERDEEAGEISARLPGLEANLDVAGTWSSPELEGAVSLTGPVESQGVVRVNEGRARLDLEGDALVLLATAGSTGWNAEATLVGVPLPILPLDGAIASGDVRAAGTWADAPSVTVTEGRIETTGGAIGVEGSLGEEISVALRLDLPLDDLQTGPELLGRVTGPVVVRSASIGAWRRASVQGSLDVAQLGWSGVQGRLSGTVGVSGVVDELEAYARLQASEGATGSLTAEVDVASGVWNVASTLAIGGVETDAEVRIGPDSVSAAGVLRWRDAALSLADADARIALRGEGVFAGWTGALRRDGWELDLTGPLGPLAEVAVPFVEDVSGGAQLRARLQPAPAAELRLTDLALAGRPVGDLTLEVSGANGPLVIRGERIEGTVSWTGTQDLDVRVRDLPVLQGVVLSAELGRSDGAIRASGRLVGAVAGSTTDVRFEADLDDGWRFEAAGEVAGGTLALDAQRGPDLGWTGTLALDDAAFGGETVTLSGTFAGDGLVPTVEADLRASGPVAAEGTLRASTDRVRVEQRIDLPGVAEPLEVAGAVWPTLDLSVKHAGETLGLRAASWSAPLETTGELTLTAAGTQISLSSGSLLLRVEPPVVDLAFTGSVQEPGDSLLDVVSRLRSAGLELQAEGAATGSIAFDLAPVQVHVDGFRYTAPSGWVVAADGALALGRGSVAGTVTIPPPGAETTWTGVPFGEPLAFELRGLEGLSYRFDLELPSGRVELEADLRALDVALVAEAAFAGGTLHADLAFDPENGASGEVLLEDVGIPTVVGAERLAVSGSLRALRNEIDLTLRASLNGNSAQVSGVWSLVDLVPAGFLPAGEGRRRVELRLRTFDPTTLPVISRRVPNLDAPLTGVLQIEPGRIFGRLLATELSVLDETLPLNLDVTGSFDELRVQGELGRSPIQFDVTPNAIEGYVRLERFPAHLAIEALVGETDVSAEITGVLRGNVPLRGPFQPDVRLATERIRLERAGVVTLGEVNLSFLDGVLTVDRAFFEGEGTYRASGVIRPNELDFTLRAQDADFGPLLGLLPSLARIGADARGDLIVDASGSLRDPAITVAVDGLDVSLAGGTYQVPTAQVRVRGAQLTTEGTIVGAQPIDGRVAFRGGGGLSLLPFRLGRIEIGVTGAATVPALGEVRDLDGTVAFGAGEPPSLDVTGSVGNPLRIAGTLAPLDLTIAGDDLAVTSPTFLIASSVLDVNGSVRQETRGDGAAYVVRGEIFADQARFALGIRPESERTGPRERSPALERVIFDGVRIDAPRQLQLSENFGTLEGRADLVLGGSAASPTLSGVAAAVRGNVRFFGRDFDLVTARAVFERTRGIYPEIFLEARTTADTSRVLAGISDRVRFVVPRDGQSFEIDLVLAGELEPTPGARRAFRIQVEPELSSSARIEVDGESDVASGPRPLLDAELLSIVTLGRLEINPQLGGEEGIASAVAGATLDTVVDFLLVSELQRSLSEALGVDVVEIRTSNLSQVFSGAADDPFSVSLRLGGYLTEDLFASYRIGRFDDANAELGFTNEVRFTYELGPVALDLAGTVGFESIGVGTPIPGVSAAVRYEVTPLIDLETSIDLSNAGNRARFGVTFRW